MTRTSLLIAALMLGTTGLAHAQQPPPTSAYPDGTGNVAVDALNAGQLDQNYRGPRYLVPPRPVRRVAVPYGYAPPRYVYPRPVYVYPNGY